MTTRVKGRNKAEQIEKVSAIALELHAEMCEQPYVRWVVFVDKCDRAFVRQYGTLAARNAERGGRIAGYYENPVAHGITAESVAEDILAA